MISDLRWTLDSFNPYNPSLGLFKRINADADIANVSDVSTSFDRDYLKPIFLLSCKFLYNYQSF